VAEEAKVKGAFEGNVVDLGVFRLIFLAYPSSDELNHHLGSKFSAPELTAMFYPVADGATTFKYPSGRKLKISGCASKEDLAAPEEFDIQGERCLMVGKDGNTTDLTVGRYAGLESFTFNKAGVVSRELAIYNSGNKAIEVFSAKGDSGFLVWHMRRAKRTSSANSTRATTKAVRPAITSLIALQVGGSWPRLRRSTRTPSFTPKLGRFERNFSGLCRFVSLFHALYIADKRRSLCDGEQFHIVVVVVVFFGLFTSTMPLFPSSRCRLRILPLPTPNCPHSHFLAPGYVLAVIGACACLAR
jgi:hypothetical protein